MMRRLAIVLLVLATPAFAEPPKTNRVPVVDTYHGDKVTDQYRWLEDWKHVQVKAWSEAQNRYARGYLEKLPNLGPIRKRVSQILSAKTANIGTVVFRGGKYFVLLHKPPRQQPYLVVTDSLDNNKGTVVVDPNQLDKSGGTSIDWFHPSPDGKLIAVSLSKAGTERGDLSLFDISSGKKTGRQIAHVNSGTAGGDLAWTADSKGFYYTRHLKLKSDSDDDNVFQNVYFHRLGDDPSQDRYELGKGFPQIAEIQLDVDERTGRVLATVQKGDGGQFAHYLREPSGRWRQFSRFGDKVVQAVFGPTDDLFVVTMHNAPRGKLVRISDKKLSVTEGRTVIAEAKDTIVSSGIAFWGETTVLPTKDRLYVVYQLGGPSVIRAFGYDGRPLAAPKQLPVSAVHGLFQAEGKIVFGNNSFVDANAIFAFDPQSGKTRRTAFYTKSPVDFSNVEVVREFATSKDGTRVPVNIIKPTGIKLDGSNPCIVYGYGGYGVNITPRFRPLTTMLSERGVIYAVANLRGGGEYGEEWHRQGNLTNKQNVFDDFAAVVQHMSTRGYTSPDKTGILGGSNGGLLMGATITQHPDKVACVVSLVGIYDMLRVELSPNGKFNITEFGTVKNPDHYRALRAYSPYHNVKNGAKYPATLFLTGANDPRVDPMQSRKMTARLQAANGVPTPILLRTSADTGHGGNTSLKARIEEYVDIHAFFFEQLGVKF